MDRGATLGMTGTGSVAAPAGFLVRRAGAHTLYVAQTLEEAVSARGLDRWETWERALASGESSSGRGISAVIPGPGASRWRLKRMRRGGRLAAVWRDRYPSPSRLVETLAASAEAHSRGVATAAPVALILESQPGGMVRGAMAFTEIEASADLARLLKAGGVSREELSAAIGVVRAMHDRGIRHPDLNLGNLLLRRSPGLPPEAFVIDFDRATVHPGPLGFAARQAGVRRLERSCAKLTGDPGPLGPGSEDLWYTLYAGEDRNLARRFDRGRAVGRFALSAHRLGWKREKE